MKKNFLFFLLIILFFSNIFTQNNDISYEDMWLSFPACHMGRLQSPVRLNISESKYSNSFSIVYQYFSEMDFENKSNNFISDKLPSMILNPKDKKGYINLQRNGVIKQYTFDHIEIFRGLHKVESDRSQFEVHLIFEKQLGFSTNQNQYRRITDTNKYLSIVLRYNSSKSLTKKSFQLVSDGGLIKKIIKKESLKFNDYPIFDRRAFFYEGSQIYNPCSEEYNYIVLFDTFFSSELKTIFTDSNWDSNWATRDFAHSYDRPIYRNFMNYTETISSGFIKINLIKIIGFLTIIFL